MPAATHASRAAYQLIRVAGIPAGCFGGAAFLAGGVVKRQLPLPLLAAALALAGALGATVFLYAQAHRAAETMLDQRLLGAGNAAALLLGPTPAPVRLRALMDASPL